MKRTAPPSLAAVLAAVLVLGMAAGAVTALAGEETPHSNQPATESAGASSTGTPSNDEGGASSEDGSEDRELSTDPLSFQLAVEGIVVQLPCTVADLQESLRLALAESDAGLTLESGHETVVTLYRGDPADGVHVSMSAYNASGAELPIEACTLSSIIFSTNSFGGVEVELPGGLALGASTPDEALAAWGAPSECRRADGSDKSMVRYRDEDPGNPFRCIDLWFEDGILSEVDFELGYAGLGCSEPAAGNRRTR